MNLKNLLIINSLVTLSIFTNCCFAQTDYSQKASEKWHNWINEQKEFPLAAWAYFGRFSGSTEEYQMYKNAGLNLVQAPIDQVENAAKAGLRVFIGTWDALYEDKEKLNAYTDFARENSDKVAGIILKDEPDPIIFDKLGNSSHYVYDNLDSDVIPFTTLVGYWYGKEPGLKITHETFMREYVEQLNPCLLVSTQYPCWDDGTDRKRHYLSNEMFRRYSLEYNIGLMGFVLVTPHRVYREISDSDIRWQVYTHLAYGAKGLFYYNYRIKPVHGRPQYGMENGIVDYETGQPTRLYGMIKTVNLEVKALGPILLKLRSTGIFHTGDRIPDGTTRFMNHFTPTTIQFDHVQSNVKEFYGDDFLIGEFESTEKPGNDCGYLLIVNKRHGKDMASTDLSLQAMASLKLYDDYKNLFIYDIASEKFNKLKPSQYAGRDGFYSLSLGGGQGVLLKYTKH